MAQAVLSSKSVRPFLVTLLCILGFLFGIGALFSIANPEVLDKLLAYGYDRFMLSCIKTMIAIVAFIGYWKMRRWGVYLFAAMTFGGIAAHLSILGPIWWPALMPNLLVIVVGLVYFKKMS